MKNILILICLILFSCDSKSQETLSAPVVSKEKISEVKNFVKGKKYSQNIAIFIDFKIPSSKFRFFIYDLEDNKILEKAIVSHGSGSVIKNSDDLKFSNNEGSYQSSLGKYEIANSYLGTFGKSYRLKGLDKTNSNAMQRAIVLHSLGCVSDVESDDLACLSLGCPMLSKKFFTVAAKYIDSSKKPIILYAYY